MVNFDLEDQFPRPMSQQRRRLPPPPRTACSHAGVGAGGGRSLPLRGSRGVTARKFFGFLMPNPAFGGQFGPENKLIEGQPNEYDAICWNASVLAFHLWPTIFAGAPFRLQNICQNSSPPRSHTTCNQQCHSTVSTAATCGSFVVYCNSVQLCSG